MKHEEVWRAIDTLAAEAGMSSSGLAKRAGLDPTTFNRSKRHMPDGRARWPSTESLSKALVAAGANLETFSHLVAGGRVVPTASKPRHHVPLIGMAQAGGEGFFSDGGYPAGIGWDEIGVLEVGDPNAYGLEISGDSMEPVFRDGDVIVVSPEASIRRGDRVVVRTKRGEVMAKHLSRRSAKRIELRSFNPAHPDYNFDVHDIAWMHRIIWASQ